MQASTIPATEVTAVTLPAVEDILDWDLAIGGSERPLRFCTADDLREHSRVLQVQRHRELATAFSCLAMFVPDGQVVGELDDAAILFGLFGDDAVEDDTTPAAAHAAA